MDFNLIYIYIYACIHRSNEGDLTIKTLDRLLMVQNINLKYNIQSFNTLPFTVIVTKVKNTWHELVFSVRKRNSFFILILKATMLVILSHKK